MNKNIFYTVVLSAIAFASLQAKEPNRRVYFGETHLHTNLSGDAYLADNTLVGPDEAYRYSKGMPVLGPVSRAVMQRKRALDFTAVTDHAEYMGIIPMIEGKDELMKKSKLGSKLIEMWHKDKSGPLKVYREVGGNFKKYTEFSKEEFSRPVWEKVIKAAERHNKPGKFTTFIGWEWTSNEKGANLHRVVLLNAGAKKAKKILPYSAMGGNIDPEDLWGFMDRESKDKDIDMLAIPHNSNLSANLMFAETTLSGKPITAEYAKTRMKWEPVVEITQMKGDSETHPALSKNDEFANYEKYEHLIDFNNEREKGLKQDYKANYVRGALMRGMEIEDKIGINPYKFGVIGSSDSHTGLSNSEEFGVVGKFGVDTMPANKSAIVVPGATGWDMSAAGLAAVWAEENTRDSIFKAIKRRETYATTGTFIKLRVFGGWDFEGKDAEAKDLAGVGYKKGVPMGGELTRAPSGKKVKFLIHAVKDEEGANLDRVQVVKGWIDSNGKSHEKVYNVAWSKGRGTNPNKVKAVGNTVDMTNATYKNTIGAPELYVVWEDKDFDPKEKAFYYVRVLEIPTPRHSLATAIALGMDHKKTGKPATIQERAYSSPIWYTPSQGMMATK